MKNTTKATVTKLHVFKHHKAKVFLTGAAVLQLVAASTAGAATTAIIGGSGMNPWGATGSVTANLPTANLGSVDAELFNTTPHSTTVGNWDISGSGASSISALGINAASWAAETKVTSNSVDFNLDIGGLVGGLVEVPVAMTWAATIDTGTNYQANTRYDVSFDLTVAGGLLSNAAGLGETFSVRFVDGNGDPVVGTTSVNILDVVGLFDPSNSGTYTQSYTTGDTVPTGDIQLQFVATKGLSAEVLGLSSDYAEISGLTLDGTPVPEPSGGLLLGAGALLFIMRRRV